MEGKHTPGPWQVVRPSVGVDANWHVTDKDDTFVAHVYGFGHAVDEKSLNNARLIAAAPDLLGALIEIYNLRELGKKADESYPLVVESLARKAIDLATGEQHGSKQA